MGQADFKHGDPLMVDYTPSSDATGGDVVVIGNLPFVLHFDIAADVKDSIAAGGGVYDAVSDGSLDSGGLPVYWDDTENEFVAGTSGNAHFGFTVPDSGTVADQGIVRAIHDPSGAAIV